MALRVVFAEDNYLVRQGVTSSLTEVEDIDVVAVATDLASLLRSVAESSPDVVLTDIRMPPTHTAEGLEAARQIRQTHPQVAILVLSAHAEVEHAMELLAGGDRIGYLLKSRVTDVADFIEGVERIARGGSVVDPGLVQELVAARRRHDPLDALTPREREVLALMAEGYSNAGIARRLFVSEGTVEKHVHSILPKLQIPETEDEHRRVLAVITFLEAR
jgi:serine/threonine-protein kinase PknK